MSQEIKLKFTFTCKSLPQITRKYALYILCSVDTDTVDTARFFATVCTVGHQAPLFMEFSRQKYWSGLPCHSPGDLLHPGIKPRSPTSQADSLPFELPRKPLRYRQDIGYRSYSIQVPYQLGLGLKGRKETKRIKNHIKRDPEVSPLLMGGQGGALCFRLSTKSHLSILSSLACVFSLFFGWMCHYIKKGERVFPLYLGNVPYISAYFYWRNLNYWLHLAAKQWESRTVIFILDDNVTH